MNAVLEEDVGGDLAKPSCPNRCAILSVLPLSVVLLDEDARLLYANRRLLKYLGLASRNAFGRPLRELLPDLAPLLARLGSVSGVATWDSVACRFGDRQMTIEMSATRLGPGSPLLKTVPEGVFLITLTDVTAWYELRQERNRLLQLNAVTEAMPTILHELRNPLAGLATSMELLLEDELPGDVRMQIDALLSETRRMKLVCEGVGVAGRLLRRPTATTIADGLEAAHRILERIAKSRGIRATLQMDELPLLPFDITTLRALLFNLVTNAIHACSDGGHVVTTVEVRGDDFVLEVADDGCGMTPEERERCTQLFYTTKSNGSGIGLAMCNEVVREANGFMAIRSTRGKGTTVSLEIPIIVGRESAT